MRVFAFALPTPNKSARKIFGAAFSPKWGTSPGSSSRARRSWPCHRPSRTRSSSRSFLRKCRERATPGVSQRQRDDTTEGNAMVHNLPYRIAATKDGPYVITGAVPRAAQSIKANSEGEAWGVGPGANIGGRRPVCTLPLRTFQASPLLRRHPRRNKPFYDGTHTETDTEIGLAPDTHTDGMKRALMAVSGAALAGTKPAGRKRSVSALHLSATCPTISVPERPYPG